METIKSSNEISSLFDHATRTGTRSVAFLVNQRNQHDLPGRVAFIAGKKNGNAVWRNAAKRRLRAVCRELGGPWVGYDVVFIAKRGLLNDEYSTVLAASRKALSGVMEICD